MKSLTVCICLVMFLLIGENFTFAQTTKNYSVNVFRPHWSLNVQGGAAHTLGENEFSELLSPAAQLSATYHFHHAMGVRFGLGGWQGKGAALLSEGGYQTYAYQFGQLNVDYILDLAGAFGGFNHKRVVSPYLLAGIGGGYGFNNEQATAYKQILEYYWENKLFAPIGRAGLGLDFRLGECVSFGLEGNANILTDKFNSKRGDNVDRQFNVLASLSFRFGKHTRPSKAYAEKVPSADVISYCTNAFLTRSGKMLIINYDLCLGDGLSSCEVDALISVGGRKYRKIPRGKLQGDFGTITESGFKEIIYNVEKIAHKLYGKDISIKLECSNNK